MNTQESLQYRDSWSNQKEREDWIREKKEEYKDYSDYVKRGVYDDIEWQIKGYKEEYIHFVKEPENEMWKTLYTGVELMPEWKDFKNSLRFLESKYIIPRDESSFLNGCFLFDRDTFRLSIKMPLNKTQEEIELFFADILPKYMALWNEALFPEHEKNEQAPDRPDYIQPMIEKGLLYPDGKRVIGSLDEVISFIGPKPARLIHESFLKPNGKPYTLKHIQDIISGRK